MDYSYLILLFVLFCVISFVISCTEVALYMSNQLKLELNRNEDSFQGRFWKFFENNQVFMFSLLSLSKLVVFVGTIFTFLWIFEYFVSQQAHPENPWLLILTGSFAGILLLFINEIIPILFVPKHAEKIVKNLIFPILTLTVIMYLPTKMFHNLFEFIGKKKKSIPVRKTKRWYALSIIHPKRNPEESHDEETELQILQNALHFRNIRARDCMVTRTEIVAVNIDEDIKVLKNLFIETGLSKILVYRNSEDNIVG